MIYYKGQIYTTKWLKLAKGSSLDWFIAYGYKMVLV